MSDNLMPLLGIPFDQKKCLALVSDGLAALGIPWPDQWVSGIGDSWARGERPLDAPPGWDRLPADAVLQRGDVVLSRDGLGDPKHLALALGPRDLLHTTVGTGSIIARSRVLRGRIEAVYRRRPAP